VKQHQPALLGGLAIGVLSALPVVGGCCCLWVLGGGMLVVYLQQQAKPEPIETGEAVIGGLIAGVVGAVIMLVIKSVEMSMLGAAVGLSDRVREALDQNPQITPQMRDMIVNLVSGKGLAVLALIQLPCYAVFGMLGALLGLAFFRKKTPPAVQG